MRRAAKEEAQVGKYGCLRGVDEAGGTWSDIRYTDDRSSEFFS